jgi:hypothetical protein
MKGVELLEQQVVHDLLRKGRRQSSEGISYGSISCERREE